MCFVASIYQEGQREEKMLDVLAEALQTQLYDNPDGFALIGMDVGKNKMEIVKGLEICDDRTKEMLERYDVLHLHFRKSTSGKIAEDNIHFWNYENWFMAHNGMFSYVEYEDKVMCDSLLFFKDLAMKRLLLKKKIRIQKVRKMIEKTAWGRFIFVNKKYQTVYYFGDFNVQLMMGGKGQTVIVSSKALKLLPKVFCWGLSFVDTQEVKVLAGEIDGIFRMNLRSKRMDLLDNKPLTQDTSAYYGAKWKDKDGEIGWSKEYNIKRNKKGRVKQGYL